MPKRSLTISQKDTKKADELSARLVSEIHERLNDNDFDNALADSLVKILKATGCSAGGVFVINEQSGRLEYRVNKNLSGKYSRTRLKLGESAAEKVKQTGKPLYTSNVSRSLAEKLGGKTDLKAFAAIPVRGQSSVNGVLIVADRCERPFSEEDKNLLDGISRHIGMAIEHARLRRDIQNKDKVLRELLDEMLSIQEDERRRIARELHDETSQVLASLSANLEVAIRLLPPGDEEVRSILKKAQSLSTNILEETHKLIYQLRPTLLDDLGLVAATHWLTETTLESAGIKVDLKVTGMERRLPSKIETALYRVTQEVIANISRHSKAKNVTIALNYEPARILLGIFDNGCGFDVWEALTSEQRPRGLGLIGMRERIKQVGGTIGISSQPGGGGTTIEIEIPTQGEKGGKNQNPSCR